MSAVMSTLDALAELCAAEVNEINKIAAEVELYSAEIEHYTEEKHLGVEHSSSDFRTHEEIKFLLCEAETALERLRDSHSYTERQFLAETVRNKPIEQMPLYINHEYADIVEIAIERLRVAK
jgi:hypothetical protein